MPVNGLMGLGGGGSRGSSGAGVTVEVKLWGAAGGCSQDCGGNPAGRGGSGGFTHLESTEGQFQSGQTFHVLVGERGYWNNTSNRYGGGAGAGGNGGGSGGGGTYIGLNGSPSQNTMIAAAGGGSGGSGGRGGGGDSGQTCGANSGQGGTQNSGGAGGTGGFGGGGSSSQGGSFMQGGRGMSCKGSGGGGGYYGGGGGQGDCGACAAGCAGAGSGYRDTVKFNVTHHWGQSSSNNQPPGTSDPDYANSAGYASYQGNGNHGRCVIIIDGVKHTFGYTGSVQTVAIP